MHNAHKTKAQLSEELSQLRESQARSASLTREHELVLRALQERVKELNCLYGISRLSQNRELAMDELLRQVAALDREYRFFSYGDAMLIV